MDDCAANQVAVLAGRATASDVAALNCKRVNHLPHHDHVTHVQWQCKEPQGSFYQVMKGSEAMHLPLITKKLLIGTAAYCHIPGSLLHWQIQLDHPEVSGEALL